MSTGNEFSTNNDDNLGRIARSRSVMEST